MTACGSWMRTRADAIHPNNIQRVVRAIEVAMSGQTQVSGSEPSLYDSLLFVLHMEDRDQLYTGSTSVST